MPKQITNTWTAMILQNRQYNTYLDMNDLHGWEMCSCLTYGGFKSLKDVDNFNLNSISENNPVGYIFKVDLEYPDELHALHNDYPLALEKLAISYDMFSDYCKKIAGQYGIKVGNVMNLIPNLGNQN